MCPFTSLGLVAHVCHIIWLLKPLSALLFWGSVKCLCSVQENFPAVGMCNMTRRNDRFEPQSSSHGRVSIDIASSQHGTRACAPLILNFISLVALARFMGRSPKTTFKPCGSGAESHSWFPIRVGFQVLHCMHTKANASYCQHYFSVVLSSRSFLSQVHESSNDQTLQCSTLQSCLISRSP